MRADADDRHDAGDVRIGADGVGDARPAAVTISAKETSGPASITACDQPVSCSGRKPFGTTM